MTQSEINKHYGWLKCQVGMRLHDVREIARKLNRKPNQTLLDQLTVAKAQLAEARDELRKFQEEHGLADDSSTT